MNMWLVIAISFGALLLGIAIASLWQWHAARKQARRINELIDFLERASLGDAGLLAISGEDDLARLQDEVSKTIAALERTRNQAVDARKAYARNLSNIAHQIKTPLAALSLAAQRLRQTTTPESASTIDVLEAQIDRLTRLQGDLLLMAKLDAGVLVMDPQPHDLFTILATAVENLEALATARDVEVALAENDAVNVTVDEHWTVEAFTNLIKNCIEHAPANSAVTITYETNPLYASIAISDAGPGFSLEESHRLFERFYTTSDRTKTGTGLGLSFARELLEAQGGTIEARNLPEGGACFDIRLYSHLCARHLDVTFAS